MKTQQTKVWSVTNNRGATMHVYATDAPEAIALAEKNGFGPVSKAIIDRALTFEEPTATSAQASGNCRASHSPLPWHLSAYHQHKVVARSRGDAAICDCTNTIFRDLGEQEANAAFIVRACNNAQRLADALEEITNHHLLDGSPSAAAKVAREALAQYK